MAVGLSLTSRAITAPAASYLGWANMVSTKARFWMS